MVSNIILLGIYNHIPSKNKSIKPMDRSWLRRKVLDYSKGSKYFWSFLKRSAMHSVEKADILAEIFSNNSSLSASDQPLPFTPRATLHYIRSPHTNKSAFKARYQKVFWTRWYPRSCLKDMFFVTGQTASQFVLHFV